MDQQTEQSGRRNLIALAAVMLASLGAAACSGEVAQYDDAELQEAITQAERHAPPGKRAIVETHIHFWQVTRPGGVPWPTPAEGPIFRDVLPADYTPVARANGVVTAGIVEASGIVEDNNGFWTSWSATGSIRSSSAIWKSERRPSRVTWRALRAITASSGFGAI